MTEGGTNPDEQRLVAWARELRAVHERLRAALRAVREEAAPSPTSDRPSSIEESRALGRDLLLFCHGFCTALTGHHVGEDTRLFPAVAAAHPELRETLHALEQDHAAIAALVTALEQALIRRCPADELDRHLDGIAAIMESHFRFEERALLGVLESLPLSADPHAVLGPL